MIVAVLEKNEAENDKTIRIEQATNLRLCQKVGADIENCELD